MSISPPTGCPLPLADQLTFTDGQCEAFANALLHRFGGRLQLRALVVKDPRYARKLDYPSDAEIEAHIFCIDQEGWSVDAEGRRPVVEMMESFGVRRGYRHEITSKGKALRTRADRRQDHAFRKSMARAIELIDRHGWGNAGIPAADGALSRYFAAARAEQLSRLQPPDPFTENAAGCPANDTPAL